MKNQYIELATYIIVFFCEIHILLKGNDSILKRGYLLAIESLPQEVDDMGCLGGSPTLEVRGKNGRLQEVAFFS